MMDVIANTVSVDEYGDISLRDVQKAAEAAYAILDAAMEGAILDAAMEGQR